MAHFSFRGKFNGSDEYFPYKPYGTMEDELADLDYFAMKNGRKGIEERFQEQYSKKASLDILTIHPDTKGDDYNYSLLTDYTYIKPIIESVETIKIKRNNHKEDVSTITDTSSKEYKAMINYFFNEIEENYDDIKEEFRNYPNLATILNKCHAIMIVKRENREKADDDELKRLKNEELTKEFKVYKVYRKLVKYRFMNDPNYGKDVELKKEEVKYEEELEDYQHDNDDFIPETEEEYKLMAGGDIDNDIYKSY